MNQNEKELVERVLSGEVEVFEILVVPHRKALLGLAFRMTQDVEDAKEAAQEALFRAYKYLPNFDSDRSFKCWLFGILVNEARNIRKKRVHAGIPLGDVMNATKILMLASSDPLPDGLHENRELRGQIMDCLECLSPRERETFLLRDVEGLSIKESAKALRCSALSIRVHLSRARGKMKKTILDRFPHLAKEGR